MRPFLFSARNKTTSDVASAYHRALLTRLIPMRYDLKVPFAEKDAPKKLGARWDAANKLWYVQDKADMSPFAKWSPTPRDPAVPSASPAPRTARKTPDTSAGVRVVGSQYREVARVCECLPWEICERCAASAIQR